MEKGVFLHPAVAGPLTERFVEARLHIDYERNEVRQLDMTATVAQPVYLVVDPVTEEVLGRHDGATLVSDDPFVDFLNDGWEKARAKD